MSKLPKPINSKSSRNAMMEEIEALRDEVDAQQTEINEWRAIAEKAKHERDRAVSENGFVLYQLSVIRAALATTFAIRE